MRAELFIPLGLIGLVSIFAGAGAYQALRAIWRRKLPAHESNELERRVLKESEPAREEARLIAEGKTFTRGIRTAALAPRIEEVREGHHAGLGRGQPVCRRARLVALATGAVRKLPYFRGMREREEEGERKEDLSSR